MLSKKLLDSPTGDRRNLQDSPPNTGGKGAGLRREQGFFGSIKAVFTIDPIIQSLYSSGFNL